MARISASSPARNSPRDENAPSAPTVEELRSAARTAFEQALDFVERWGGSAEEVSLRDFERALREMVFAVGRALVVLFLAVREHRVLERHRSERGRFEWFGRAFRPAPSIARNLTTMFGVVRYWRRYMREVAEQDRHGFHPLDLSLGLSADRLSWNVLAQAARLAAQMSYAPARRVLSDFMPNAPSTEVDGKDDAWVGQAYRSVVRAAAGAG